MSFLEGQYQFVLRYSIQWIPTDREREALFKEIQEWDPAFRSTCSFDSRFYCPKVLGELSKRLAATAMPNLCTKKKRARRNDPVYKGVCEEYPRAKSCTDYLNHRRLSLVRGVGAENVERIIATLVLVMNLYRLDALVATRNQATTMGGVVNCFLSRQKISTLCEWIGDIRLDNTNLVYLYPMAHAKSSREQLIHRKYADGVQMMSKILDPECSKSEKWYILDSYQVHFHVG